MDVTHHDDLSATLAVVASVVGSDVVEVAPCRWGFTGDSEVLLLADGRRVVLQRPADRRASRQRATLTEQLQVPLAAVGIPTPAVIACDPDGGWLLFEHVAGRPGVEVVGPALAVAMGRWAQRLRAVDPDDAPLDETWASPDTLETAAKTWIAAFPDVGQLAAAAERVTARGWPAVFAHGDYCPPNVLVEDGRLVALIDLDRARLGSPLHDAAWWGAMMRCHHPDRWELLWPVFASASGTGWDTRAVADLQLLQLAEFACERDSEGWRRRVRAAARW